MLTQNEQLEEAKIIIANQQTALDCINARINHEFQAQVQAQVEAQVQAQVRAQVQDILSL